MSDDLDRYDAERLDDEAEADGRGVCLGVCGCGECAEEVEQ